MAAGHWPEFQIIDQLDFATLEASLLILRWVSAICFALVGDFQGGAIHLQIVLGFMQGLFKLAEQGAAIGHFLIQAHVGLRNERRVVGLSPEGNLQYQVGLVIDGPSTLEPFVLGSDQDGGLIALLGFRVYSTSAWARSIIALAAARPGGVRRFLAPYFGLRRRSWVPCEPSQVDVGLAGMHDLCLCLGQQRFFFQQIASASS